MAMDPIQLPDVRGILSEPKLSELISSFDPFDERMQEGTRARLSKDNSKVEEMTRETERLTAALAAQVAVRRDMNQQLQTMCEARVEASYAEFNELVATRTRLVEERLDALDERITALDEHFSEEKSRIGLEIEERHRELNEMLDKFKALFLQECEERAAREAAIKAEMEDHAVDVEERFGVEAEARETVISRLRSELSENIDSRRTSDVQFAAFVDQELFAVKASLGSAIAVREEEDGQIEKSISHFTTKLQNSLHVINSFD